MQPNTDPLFYSLHNAVGSLFVELADAASAWSHLAGHETAPLPAARRSLQDLVVRIDCCQHAAAFHGRNSLFSIAPAVQQIVQLLSRASDDGHSPGAPGISSHSDC